MIASVAEHPVFSLMGDGAFSRTALRDRDEARRARYNEKRQVSEVYAGDPPTYSSSHSPDSNGRYFSDDDRCCD